MIRVSYIHNGHFVKNEEQPLTHNERGQILITIKQGSKVVRVERSRLKGGWVNITWKVQGTPLLLPKNYDSPVSLARISDLRVKEAA